MPWELNQHWQTGTSAGSLLALACLVCGALGMVRAAAAGDAPGDSSTADARATAFIAAHEANVRPLEIEVGRRWWLANTSGRDEDFARKQEIETQLDLALADRTRFAELKAVRAAGVRDPLLHREIDVLYLQYLAKQVEPALLEQMIAKANAVEKAFNVFRARAGETELSDNDVRKVLKDSLDSPRRQAVWEASKEVGRLVEADLRALVRLRNQAATSLGFRDYHVMQLELNEQDQARVLALFDELDQLTRAPFERAKAEIDRALAARYGVPVEALRPWHYHDPFFQEPPTVGAYDVDAQFAQVDILDLCRRFYAGIGLPIEDVIARSDLYEKPGKSPHAFCIDIDRAGDVRVLANVTPSERWMRTMLHELGHAVYSSKNIPATLPYVVRGEAHILCTEGVAMMYERFARRSSWLAAMGVRVADPAAFDRAAVERERWELLIFSRWCQVMLRFEKGLYENPEQDLNDLWWDLVEKYQGLHRPEGRDAPDYASKVHVVSAPAYYHNYMLGQLFASQVHHALVHAVLPGQQPASANYVDRPAAGEFMKQKVFAPGRTLDWNALTKFATGEMLNARAFAADLAE